MDRITVLLQLGLFIVFLCLTTHSVTALRFVEVEFPFPPDGHFDYERNSNSRKLLSTDSTELDEVFGEQRENTDLIVDLNGTVYLIYGEENQVVWSFDSGGSIYAYNEEVSVTDGSNTSHSVEKDKSRNIIFKSVEGIPNIVEEFHPDDNDIGCGVILKTVYIEEFHVDLRSGRVIFKGRFDAKQKVEDVMFTSSGEDQLYVFKTNRDVRCLDWRSNLVWSLHYSTFQALAFCEHEFLVLENVVIKCYSDLTVHHIFDDDLSQAIDRQKDSIPFLLSSDEGLSQLTRGGNSFYLEAFFSILVCLVGGLIYVFTRFSFKKNPSAILVDYEQSRLPVELKVEQPKVSKENKGKKKKREMQTVLFFEIDKPDGITEIGNIQREKEKICSWKNVDLYHGSVTTLSDRSCIVKRIQRTKRFTRNHILLYKLRQLDHKRVMHYLSVQQSQQFVYFATDKAFSNLHKVIYHFSGLVNEKSLDNLDISLWESNGYPSPILINLMSEICSGLAYVHQHDVVHGNLTPQNILIYSKEDGLHAKVADISMNQFLPANHYDDGDGISYWQTWRRFHKINDNTADCFALGIVLYFCISKGKDVCDKQLVKKLDMKQNTSSTPYISMQAEHLCQMLLQWRLSATDALKHPFFWDPEKHFNYFFDLSEFCKENCELTKLLESKRGDLLDNKSWLDAFEDDVKKEFMKKQKQYNFRSVVSLVRVLRNVNNHNEIMAAFKAHIDRPFMRNWYAYFEAKFSTFFTLLYYFVKEKCYRVPSLKKYY